MLTPPSTQMTARTPMTCARISLATCAILLACAARRVKRIACVRYCFAYGNSSCVLRIASRVAFHRLPCGVLCAVRCCPMGTLCAGCAVLWERSGGYLSLLLVCLFCLRCSAPCGAVWCRGVAVVLSCLLVYCLRLQLCASCSATVSPVMLPSLVSGCQSYGLPSVIRSALACFGCAALALRI